MNCAAPNDKGLSTKQCASDTSSRIYRLPEVRDHASIDKVGDTVTDGTRVHAQVLLVCQILKNGIRE
jgi:hypothetical protein